MTTAEKTCFKCERVLPLDQFYAHPQMADGHVNKCKECNKADVRANRAANHDYYVWYDRIRSNEPHRVAAREAYSKLQKNREMSARRSAEWSKRNSEKRRAHLLVRRAVLRGILVRQPCEQCGDEKSQAHHDDYSKPLVVRWLCAKHHGEHHRAERWFGDEVPTGVDVSA